MTGPRGPTLTWSELAALAGAALAGVGAYRLDPDALILLAGLLLLKVAVLIHR